MQYNSEELYLLLLVPSAVKTVLSISQNGINQITLNKQIDNHLNMDIINASTLLGQFLSYGEW
jgi:hypothetical protein